MEQKSWMTALLPSFFFSPLGVDRCTWDMETGG